MTLTKKQNLIETKLIKNETKQKMKNFLNQIKNSKNIFNFDHVYVQEDLNNDNTFISDSSLFFSFDRYILMIEKNDLNEKMYIITKKYQSIFHNFCSKNADQDAITYINENRKNFETDDQNQAVRRDGTGPTFLVPSRSRDETLTEIPVPNPDGTGPRRDLPVPYGRNLAQELQL